MFPAFVALNSQLVRFLTGSRDGHFLGRSAVRQRTQFRSPSPDLRLNGFSGLSQSSRLRLAVRQKRREPALIPRDGRELTLNRRVCRLRFGDLSGCYCKLIGHSGELASSAFYLGS